MMMSIGSYVRRGQRLLRRWTSGTRLRLTLQAVGYFLGGFVLSAASLGNRPLPLVLAALCAGLPSWPCILLALGGGTGYWHFWGDAGAQGLVWIGAGLVISLALGDRRFHKKMPLLIPALAALSVSATGLLFRLRGVEDGDFLIFALRILAGAGGAWVFAAALDRRDSVIDWLACGLGVLALAQVAPTPWLGLGFVAAGALGAAAPFPAAALAGMALDLAQITPTPMAAVLCLSFLVRLIPHQKRWITHAAPMGMYLLTGVLFGVWEMGPAVALGIGGVVGLFLPGQPPIAHRRGETGLAQVRLEMTSGVLAEAEQLLLEFQDYPIDERALISKAADRACATCPCRNTCRELTNVSCMSPALLHRPLISTEEMPIKCRKPGRLLLELRRSQDQYRAIRADRDRQREYRQALIQQYRFLSEYLQELADSLPRRGEEHKLRYDVTVACRTAGLESANGDRCLWFSGTEGRYYVLLCDGMGTGVGAAEEGRTAAGILQRLLSVGYPPEYALRTLNSLCTLRGRAGAVTVDLAQIDLQSGKAMLYKWGAAPSYLLFGAGAEKIGTAGAPPGLSVTGTRETVDRLSLRRGETLILLSDGVDGEAAMRRAQDLTDEKPGEMASRVLQYGRGNGCDDATAAVIRLSPLALST